MQILWLFIILLTLFKLQKPLLALYSSGIAGEASGGANDAVAGNDNGDGVATDGIADSLGGHAFKTHFRGNAAGDVAISESGAIGYARQMLPDEHLEGCAFEQNPRKMRRFFALEVRIEPLACFGENWQIIGRNGI